MTVEDIAAAIGSVTYSVNSETELQAAIFDVLTDAGLPAVREVRLDARDRPDLMVGTVAVEVKTAGTWVAAVRQCQRYASHDAVDAVVLATTRTAHLAAPASIGGKPLRVVHIHGGWL